MYLPTPIFRLCLFLIAGIILQSQYQVFSVIFCLLSLLLLTFAYIVVNKLDCCTQQSAWWGVIFSIQTFMLACLLVGVSQQQSNLLLHTSRYYTAQLSDPPKETRAAVRLNVTLLASTDSTQQWRTEREKSIVYLQKCLKAEQLKVGDVILIQANFQPISTASHPGGFNYASYLQQQRIFASAYADSNQFKNIHPSTTSWSIAHFLQKTKAYVDQSFRKAHLTPDELAIAIALTLGDKQYLDPDLKQSYTAAGAVHLLAVSGLHVGIIYLLLNFLLKFMTANRSLQIARSILILICLWLYVLLTGAAPSVMRAGFMFSVFIVSDLLGQKRNSYNTLAFSAMVLLLINPLLLFDLGFQLSYTAVLGILYFQTKLTGLFDCKNRVISYLWEMLSLSFAAQLATTPIILYHFHQFPSYFLIANLFLVPLCAVVMYCCVWCLMISWNNSLLDLSGNLLNALLKLMNSTVQFVDQLPGAVINGIYLTVAQGVVLGICILLFALFMYRFRVVYLCWCVVGFIFIFTIHGIHRYQTSRVSQFVVYAVKGSCTYFIQNGVAWSLLDSVASQQDIHRQVGTHLLRFGFSDQHQIKQYQHIDSLPNQLNGICLFDGKRIAFADHLSFPDQVNQPMAVDILVVGQRNAFKSAKLLATYHPKKIVLDGSISRNGARQWLTTANDRAISIWNVQQQGAYISNPD